MISKMASMLAVTAAAAAMAIPLIAPLPRKKKITQYYDNIAVHS